MAKSRMINTRFWDDNYTSDLDPIEKLLFLYFLTNTSTNICGVYEIPLKKIAMDTGIDKEMVLKIIERFSNDGKIFYAKGWICLKNFIKNQNQKSPTVQIGIKNELMAIPKDIIDIFIGYGYPIASNLIKSNLIKSNIGDSKEPHNIKNNKKTMKKNSFNYSENKHSDSYEDEINIDTGEYIKPTSTKKYPNAKVVFDLFGKYPANWKMNTTQLKSAENLFTERGVDQIIKALNFLKENKDQAFCPEISSPYDLDSKWAKVISFKKKLQ